VPVTVTITVPVTVKVHESVEEPEPPATVAGVRVHAELPDTSATLLAKPFTGAIVTVDVPAEFTTTDTAVGLTETVKSGRPVTV
jgi:hypothetical protein